MPVWVLVVLCQPCPFACAYFAIAPNKPLTHACVVVWLVGVIACVWGVSLRPSFGAQVKASRKAQERQASVIAGEKACNAILNKLGVRMRPLSMMV